jgi:hypothetical protein
LKPIKESIPLERQTSGGSRFKASQSKQFERPYLKNTQYKKGLLEWLKQ